MKRLPKILLGGLAAIVLLAVALAITLFLVLDPDDYRSAIADAVELQTGRKLQIDGSLSPGFWPCCGIAVGPSRLSNPNGFPDTDFAQVDNVSLQVRLWPLISRQEVIIGGVQIDGLRLALIRRDDGVNNWTFESADSPPDSDNEPDAEAAGGLPEFSIAGITLKDAAITLQDAGAEYQLEDIHLETGPVGSGVPFNLKLGLTGRSLADDLEGRVELSADVLLDLNAQTVNVDDLSADLGVSDVIEIKDFVIDNLKYDLEAQTVNVDGLTADIGVSDDIDIQNFSIESVQYDVEAGQGKMNNLQAAAALMGVTAEVGANARFSDADFNADGNISLQTFSPRAVLEELEQDLETSDPAVLSEATGSATWSAGSDRLSLADLKFRMDDTTVTGHADIKDFASPRVKFDLVVDQINLDRYLPPETDESAPVSGTQAGDDEIDLEPLRELNLNGKINVGQMQAAGAKVSGVKASVRAASGLVTLDPLAASLYGGSYGGKVVLDASGPELKLSTSQSVNEVQLADLLQDVADTADLDGVMTARVKINGSGKTQAGISESLAGDVSLNLAEGVYHGVDLWHEIQVARALIRRNPPPPAPPSPETQITALSMTGQMNDGVLSSSDMLAEIPFARLSGGGDLNWIEETLGYRFNVEVVQAPQLPDGEVLDDLTGLIIPFTLSGAAADPTVKIDLENLTKNVAEEKLREKLIKELGGDEEPKEGEEESTGDVLKRGLRDLLKR